LTDRRRLRGISSLSAGLRRRKFRSGIGFRVTRFTEIAAFFP
jgi:hypothetical protein